MSNNQTGKQTSIDCRIQALTKLHNYIQELHREGGPVVPELEIITIMVEGLITIRAKELHKDNPYVEQ